MRWMNAVFCCTAILSCIAVSGADTQPPMGDRPMRGGPGGPGGPGGMMFGRIQAENEIRAKFPAEAAELEKARAEWETKYAALAKKAGVTLPESMDDRMRKLRAADPAAFDAALAKMKSDPRAAMTELRALADKNGVQLMPGRRHRGDTPGMNRESDRPSMRQMQRPDLAKLRRKYPEEMEKYARLRQNDPQAARKLLMELLAKENGQALPPPPPPENDKQPPQELKK